jgi:hypothetical protein
MQWERYVRLNTPLHWESNEYKMGDSSNKEGVPLNEPNFLAQQRLVSMILNGDVSW